MKFKNFEIRPYKHFNGSYVDGKYELVKWNSTGNCFVVAFIEYDTGEQWWDFRGVGLRYQEHYEDGLNEFILKYLAVLLLVEKAKHEEE